MQMSKLKMIVEAKLGNYFGQLFVTIRTIWDYLVSASWDTCSREEAIMVVDIGPLFVGASIELDGLRPCWSCLSVGDKVISETQRL